MTDEIKTIKKGMDTLTSVKAVYKYLYSTFVESPTTDEQRRQVKERFQNRKCLWDEFTDKFWKPIHAFQNDVPFFGSRRVTIPFTHRTGEVYELLGQKRSPNVEDYLDFLQELASEYKNIPLNKEDFNYAIQVLQRLEAQLSLEGRSVKNLPVLTANSQLRLADQVFIADAPWHKDYIDPNLILHSQVSVKLAKSAGIFSLLRDAIERPMEVSTAFNTKGNDWCQEWQSTLNSREFISGLRRLIFHEQDSEPVVDITWLTTAKVLPASLITVDLLLKDENRMASKIPGIYYFDKFKIIFHIISSDSKFIIICYLAESINNQLGQYALKNLLPLASIIDAEPRNIKCLLDELRIKSLSIDDNFLASLATLEDSFDLGKVEKWGQQWAIAFYQWVGYSNFIQDNTQDAYELSSKTLQLPEIQATVKISSVRSSLICLQEAEWSKIAQ
ncbi:MAG: hypothetical protein KME08_06495 [Aphanothece sp. CMT-3BRIN-NPC111]|jgi:sacsin|nr:hypothetical protein [Aphanothece sp. CMT-3BRIN-NPC111]